MPLLLALVLIGLGTIVTVTYVRSPKTRASSKSWGLVFVLMMWAGISLGLWVLRPTFHGFCIEAVLSYFMGWLGLIIVIVGGLVWAGSGNAKYVFMKRIASIAVIAFGATYMFCGLFNTYFMRAMVYNDIKDSIVSLETLPESSPTQRMIPRQIATNKVRNLSSISNASVGDMHYILEGGRILMSGGFNPVWGSSFTGKVENVAFIDVSSSGAEPQIVNQRFEYGPHLRWADNLSWCLVKKSFWSLYSDPIYVHDSQYPADTAKLLMLVPTRRMAFGWYSIFPVWRPVFTGVWKVYPDGEFVWVPKEKIASDPDTRIQRVFPEEMARIYGLSISFSRGVWNAMFVHNDQAVLQDPDWENNTLPYFIAVGENEPTWFIYLKPYGSNARGLKSLLFIDAVSGTPSIWAVNVDKMLMSPSSAVKAVKENQQFRNVKWASGSGEGYESGLVVAEALPIFQDGRMVWWRWTITGENMNVVTQIVLSNTEIPEDIVVFNDSDDVQRFIEGNITLGEGPRTDLLPAESTVTEMIGRLEALPGEFRSEMDRQMLDVLKSIQLYLMTQR